MLLSVVEVSLVSHRKGYSFEMFPERQNVAFHCLEDTVLCRAAVGNSYLGVGRAGDSQGEFFV